jgi:hypothetical protein
MSDEYSDVSFDYSESDESSIPEIPIRLKTIQQKAFDDLLAATLKHGMSFNGGQTGTGKTVMTIEARRELSKFHKKPVIIIALIPASLRPEDLKEGIISSSPWQRETIRYGEEDNIKYFTYESLHSSEPSVKNKIVYTPVYPRDFSLNSKDFVWDQENDEQAAHGGKSDIKNDVDRYTDYQGLIVRKDVLEKGKWVTTFSPTKAWMQYCMDNIVFVVMDEAHKLKNNTAQSNAAAAVIRAVRRARRLREDKASYFAFLTATPGEKESHAMSYLNIMGSDDPVYDRDMFVTGKPRTPMEAYSIAYGFDKKAARGIALENGVIDKKGSSLEVSSRNNNAIAAEFWTKIILPEIQFVVLSATTKQLFNFFVNVGKRESNIIRKAIKDLKHNSKTLGAQSNAKNQINRAMMSTLVRLAAKNLKEDKNCQVIIGLKLIESVDDAIILLQDKYGMLENEIGRVVGSGGSIDASTGKRTSKKSAKKNMKRFQDGEIRVLVGTVDKLANSWDLHDKVGGRQRHSYIVGDDDTTKEQQFAGRTARFESESVPIINICYPKENGDKILGIYDNNVRKAKEKSRLFDMREDKSIPEVERLKYKSLIKSPGEYDRAIELDDGEIVYLIDSLTYDPETKELWPNFPFGFIEEDTDEGRAAYRDTKNLINYIQTNYDEGIDIETLPGIAFQSRLPPDFRPPESGHDDTDESESDDSVPDISE